MTQPHLPILKPWSRRTKIVLAAAATLLVLVASYYTWLGFQSPDSPWSTEVPNLPSDMDGHARTRAWLHDDLYIGTALNLDAITARTTATGEPAWNLTLEAPLCGAGHDPEDGLVAVQFHGETACDQLALIDLADGTMRWQTTLETEKPDDRFIDVKFAIGDGVVVASWSGAEHAVRLHDGETVWSGPPQCHTRSWTGGHALLQVLVCDDDVAVQRIDPETGQPHWSHDVPDTTYTDVVSTDPVVVRVPGDFIVLDDGTERLRIPADDQYGFNCTNYSAYDCDVLVDGDTLYTYNMVLGDDDLFHRGMSAIDLTTGDRSWSTEKSDAAMGTPIHIDDGHLVSIAERKDIRRTGSTVRIAVVKTDVATGEVTEHMAVSTGHIPFDDVTYLIRYADDTLVVQREYCKAGTSGETFAHAYSATP